MKSLLAGLLALVAMSGLVAAQGLAPDAPELLSQAKTAEAVRGIRPATFDISAAVPPPGRQHISRTCTAWAVAYAAASSTLRAPGATGPVRPFSPAFTYALAGGSTNCQRGTSITRALETLRLSGALPLEEFAFSPYACTREPTARELARAAQWKIAGWSKLDAQDLDTVRGQLLRGRPVIFAMNVGPAFNAHRGEAPFRVVETGDGLEGHAMVLVGYDNLRGAFRLLNSFGPDWGDGGYAWIDYATWRQMAGSLAFVID